MQSNIVINEYESSEAHYFTKKIGLIWFASLILVGGLVSIIWYLIVQDVHETKRKSVEYDLNNELELIIAGDVQAKTRLLKQFPAFRDYDSAIKNEVVLPLKATSSADCDVIQAKKNASLFARYKNTTLSIGKIHSLQNISVIGGVEDGAWLKVLTSNSYTGWMHQSLLKQSDESKVGVLKSRTRLRHSPRITTNNIIAVLESGSRLNIVGTDKDWVRVEIPKDFQYLLRQKNFKEMTPVCRDT